MIALLDGRKLRIELSGIRANYDGAKKRRESALALGNIAESQIASSEMNRFQSKIEILEQQLTQLEVRSPIHGLVLNGDLEKAEGAPLEMGQTLFEIAPLTEMVAEIRIPEIGNPVRQIRHAGHLQTQCISASKPGLEKLNIFIHARRSLTRKASLSLASVSPTLTTNSDLECKGRRKSRRKRQRSVGISFTRAGSP